MTQSRLSGIPLRETILQGIRYGHTHGKKEHREDYVSHTHSIFEHLEVRQKMRYTSHRPKIIDKDHQKHGQSPENIYGRVTLCKDSVFHKNCSEIPTKLANFRIRQARNLINGQMSGTLFPILY